MCSSPFNPGLLGQAMTSNGSSKKPHSTHHRLLTICCAGKSAQQQFRRRAHGRQFSQVHTIKRGAPALRQHLGGTTDGKASQQLQRQQHQGGHADAATECTVDPQHLCACIQAAATFSQLQAVCNTFLGHDVFSPAHAALVLSRLHLVSSRPTDSQLLLVELLAQRLAAGCCGGCPVSSCQPGYNPNQMQQQQQQPGMLRTASQRQWLSCGEVAAVAWAFARAGYQPSPELMQQLLQQFWVTFGHQQQQQSPCHATQPTCNHAVADSSNGSGCTQQQQQKQQWPPVAADEALATLVAALAGLGCRDSACWARVRAAVQVALSDTALLPVHSLQQLLWGFATVRQGDAAIVQVLATALHDRLAELDTAEDLVQAVWSLHCMGCTHRSLFETAAQLMVQKLHAGPNSSHTHVGHGLKQQQQPALQRPLCGSGVGGSAPPGTAQGHPVGDGMSLHRAQQAAKGLVATAADTTAAACRSAATQALGALQQHDPLLCMLALYRDYYRPAHST